MNLVEGKGAPKIRDEGYKKLQLSTSLWETFLQKDLSNLINHIDIW